MVNAVFTLLEYRDEVAMDRQYALSIDGSDPSLITDTVSHARKFLRGEQLNLGSK